MSLSISGSIKLCVIHSSFCKMEVFVPTTSPIQQNEIESGSCPVAVQESRLVQCLSRKPGSVQ